MLFQNFSGTLCNLLALQTFTEGLQGCFGTNIKARESDELPESFSKASFYTGEQSVLNYIVNKFHDAQFPNTTKTAGSFSVLGSGQLCPPSAGYLANNQSPSECSV